MALHIYIGGGWFLQRLPDGGLHARVMSEELTGPHGAATIRAEFRISADQWIEALAMLTGRTLDEARKFLALSE